MNYSNLLVQLEQKLQGDTVKPSEVETTIGDLKIWTNSHNLIQEIQNNNLKLLCDMRKFEELMVIYSVKAKDFEELERTFKRLNVFNLDLKDKLPKSDSQDKILSIYLLYLLSFNRHPEYHINIERIPEHLHNNELVIFIKNLEEWLTLGNYSKVLHARNNSPISVFNTFLERIVDTVRFEIARSAEKAYDKLKLKDAQEIFLLSSPQELKTFIAKEEQTAKEKGIIWKVNGDYLYFTTEEDINSKLSFANGIPGVLKYAAELEKIV